MTKVLIADSHELLTEGLALILARKEALTIAGTANDAVTLLAKLRQGAPDVLILDRELKGMDAKELLGTITQMMQAQKIIYLSNLPGTKQYRELGNPDIGGFLTKECVVAELACAIRKVHDGGQYFSRDFDSSTSINGKMATHLLNEREGEILQLICKEYRTEDIASLLSLSIPTVELHRKKLRQKLGAKTNVGLALAAFKKGLIR